MRSRPRDTNLHTIGLYGMGSPETLRRQFRAPWSWKLWTVTLAAGGGLAIGLAVSGSLWVRVLLLGPWPVVLAFSVWGYSVQDGQVFVHHPGWATRLDLAGLQAVEAAPGIMRGSTMTFANGGLFGFVGHFRNGTLGAYRAYATKGENAVVLYLLENPVVVTPDDPAAFVEVVETETGAAI